MLTMSEVGRPVRVLPFRCPAVAGDAVFPLLRVELGERLIAEGSSLPPDVVVASVLCDGDGVTILATRPGAKATVVKRLRLSTVDERARPRATAVAISELLRTEPVEEHPPVSALPPASVVSQTRPLVSWDLGTIAFAYSSALDHPLFGAQLRLATGPRPASGSRWVWGLSWDLNVANTSFESTTSRGGVLQFGMGSALLARRSGGTFMPELAIGARVVKSRFRSSPILQGSSAADLVDMAFRRLAPQGNIGGGPFASMALEGLVHPVVALRAAVEMGYAIEGAGTPYGAGVSFYGGWILFSLACSYRTSVWGRAEGDGR